jgi:sortase (surface protein transpeptidase)
VTLRWLARVVLVASTLGLAVTGMLWRTTASTPGVGRLPPRPSAEASAPAVTSPVPRVADPRPAPLGTRAIRLEALDRRDRVAPVGLRVPDLGVDAPVVPVGASDDGEMEVPPDASVVAWYEHGPSPGQQGSAVLAAHVDYDGALGVFFRLTEATPGARLTVTYADGAAREFQVVARRQYPKPELPSERVFARTGPAGLVLVTCGGEFDDAARSYRENVVVYAEPVPRPAVTRR